VGEELAADHVLHHEVEVERVLEGAEAARGRCGREGGEGGVAVSAALGEGWQAGLVGGWRGLLGTAPPRAAAAPACSPPTSPPARRMSRASRRPLVLPLVCAQAPCPCPPSHAAAAAGAAPPATKPRQTHPPTLPLPLLSATRAQGHRRCREGVSMPLPISRAATAMEGAGRTTRAPSLRHSPTHHARAREGRPASRRRASDRVSGQGHETEGVHTHRRPPFRETGRALAAQALQPIAPPHTAPDPRARPHRPPARARERHAVGCSMAGARVFAGILHGCARARARTG
jgi:hypothetical protein